MLQNTTTPFFIVTLNKGKRNEKVIIVSVMPKLRIWWNKRKLKRENKLGS